MTQPVQPQQPVQPVPQQQPVQQVQPVQQGATVQRDRDYVPARVANDRETKPFFKTSEFLVYAAMTIAVLIAALVVDAADDGQRFSPYQAWWLVSLLTIGYMISRGLAKSGSRHR